MLKGLLISYCFIVNVIGFIVMGRDKTLAKAHKWRIQEKTLWGLAVIGGAIGMTIAMNVFHHKTRHLLFKVGFPFLAIVDLVIFIILLR